MRIEELRIGNYVEYNRCTGIVYAVHSPMPCEDEHFRDIGIIELVIGGIVTARIDEIQPIRLTEELLLKFGFVCFAESEVSKGFSIGTNPVTNDYMLTLTWLKDIFKNNLDNYPFFKNGHHLIKHIHQLQNLYHSLTGKELEIKK